MDRPVLNPQIFPDSPPPARPRGILHLLLTAIRQFARILLLDLLDFSSKKKEPPSPRLILRACIHRLSIVPIMIALLVAGVVYLSTHPPALAVDMDPGTQGQYYEPVNLVSADGVRNEAWIIPALDAHQVISLGDEVIGARRPAVILVHDFGASRQQMLPLVRPLHDAGMVVMIIGLRGESTPSIHGQTFGLAESLDVLAALDVLKRRRSVDPAHIAILGIGSGATAARMAAKQDDQVAALVLEDAAVTSDGVIALRLAPTQRYLSFLRPLCKWVFQTGYNVDADDLNYSATTPHDSRPILILDSQAESSQLKRVTIRQVTSFFHHYMTAALADAHE
jgi:pimeloyl-ACP methyl ester carboxylesterase